MTLATSIAPVRQASPVFHLIQPFVLRLLKINQGFDDQE
ncbi:MAG: hypothetical protein J07HQW2_03183 [Haloquadratum walsbyi J07HQW2]|uniref:Uncharacterized protein n=1 Tax=Haloquadratum walsbyi J07HQW2 TaxID=1238425 RepID=U1NHN6_9EURY|nr:MAG: hypothetical protein J07HQW2_03183 [Haloquadratum walsbyi J07HQW2]